MNPESAVFVAGHRGLLGSALVRRLREKGYRRLILRTRKELDLRDQAAVRDFFEKEKPDAVFLAAARVGGIYANATYPAEFIYDNLAIQTNVIDAAYRSGVRKLLFVGTSNIYPEHAPQPLREEYLLTGKLEPTSEPYAIAKIAGLKMCEAYNRQYGTDYMAVMPTNLYGIGDNFDLATSHVIPALIRKFHEAKKRDADIVEVWGSGDTRREFLYADDLADACIFLMENYSAREIGGFVNVGTGTELTVRELAELIRRTVGFAGEIRFNPDKPEGMTRKLLDISRITALGWKPSVSLEEGLRRTYEWYVREEETSGAVKK